MHFVPPPRKDWDTIESYMTTAFFASFLSCINENTDISALIGIHNSLFYIDKSGVIECIDRFASIGEGSGVAIGSLYSTHGLPSYKRISIALNAATRYTNSVRPPYTILDLHSYNVGKYYSDIEKYHNDVTDSDIPMIGASQ
jgi:hypothetical protein